MGRMYGWLLICDPSDQSLTELAAALDVSKTAVSTVARQLQEAAMIERFPTADRQHRYLITPGGWTRVLGTLVPGARLGVETLELGLSVLGENRAEQRTRLAESRDFFAFITHDTGEMIRRWEEYRSSKDKSGRSGR
jgi:DNA-binding transcriptional regulator GbsR (MarR family)